MKNKIITVLSLLAGIFLLNSCLKDDLGEYWKDDLKGKMYATFSTPGFQAKSLLPVADEVIISVPINIATDAPPTKDITVTFALNNSQIASYDSTLKATAITNGDTTKDGKLIWKDYKPFPSVVLMDPSVTIPAGSRTGVVRVKVARADTVKLLGNYMVAIDLTSVTEGVTIAKNMDLVLLAFPIANQYEGNYASEGFRNHPVNGIEPYKYAKLAFTTVNANTVHKTQVGNYSGYGLDITILDATMVVAGVTVNLVKLQITGMASATDMGVINTYNGEPMNYYNPVTKVFELYYFYNAAAPRILRETDSKL